MIPDVSALTTDELIGQTLCLGWSNVGAGSSQSPNSHARALVEEMGVGSVVLLGRNVRDPGQISATLAELQALAPIPLLVQADQEGGRVNRMPRPFHQFPGNMALGAVARERGAELAREQGRAVARELRSVGVNWLAGPVLDVNNNPANPVIGVRSFGEDPERVAALGTAFIEGAQREGVLACGKHFPGHGDTAVDSHFGLPVITGERQGLEVTELVPFRAAIEAGVGSIMTSHIRFPALDAERPATLSPAILTGLLRRELGFAGVIVTDCLEMDAIRATVGSARGAVEALKAGADVALICHTLTVQREAFAAIRAAVDSGELSRERLRQSADRLLAAKRRIARYPAAPASAWADPEHDALERTIARESVTFIRNSGGLPLAEGEPILVVTGHPAGAQLAAKMDRMGLNTRVHLLSPAFAANEAESALREIEAHRSGPILAAVGPKEPWSGIPVDQDLQAALVRAIHRAAGARLVVVSLMDPYAIGRFPEIQNYACGYGFRECALRAMAEALAGRIRAAGRCPVTTPPADLSQTNNIADNNH